MARTIIGKRVGKSKIIFKNQNLIFNKIKVSGPKEERISDWFDVFNEDPYKIDEVVKNKVWKVEYKLQNNLAFR